MSILFKLSKGFIYGILIGLIFATAVYILATAVFGLGFMTMTPIALASIVFAAGVMSGVSAEYGKWLATQTDAGVLFGLADGFIEGTAVGLFFATAIYILGLACAGLGFLTSPTPAQLAALIFAACVMAFVGIRYSTWLDAQESAASKS